MHRALLGTAALAALAFVGLSIALRIQAPRDTAAVERKSPPPATIRVPADSPQPLAALHREGGRLLTGGKPLSDRLAELRGFPVVLNVWASWCPPCRDELPLFSTASTRFGTRVAFLGADVEDDSESAEGLLASEHLSYPSYAAGLGEVNEIASAQGTPVTIFLGASGQLLDEHIGAYRSQVDLDRDIRRYALDVES